MKYKKYVSSAIASASFAVLAITIPISTHFADAATANISAPAGMMGMQQGSYMGMGWGGGHRGQSPGPGMIRPVVVGEVTSINGNSLIVTQMSRRGFASTTEPTATTTFTVDASNAVVVKDNATSTVSSIAIGDMVAVQGSINGTNVTASTIRDGFEMRIPENDQANSNGFHHSNNASSSNNMPFVPGSPITGNGQPLVAGTITAINGTSISITNKSNVSYTIDASNAKIVEHQNTITLSNLSVGDTIIVQGPINGTTVSASSIIDQKMPTTPPSYASSTGNIGGLTAHVGGEGLFGSIGGFFSRIFGF